MVGAISTRLVAGSTTRSHGRLYAVYSPVAASDDPAAAAYDFVWCVGFRLSEHCFLFFFFLFFFCADVAEIAPYFSDLRIGECRR